MTPDDRLAALAWLDGCERAVVRAQHTPGIPWPPATIEQDRILAPVSIDERMVRILRASLTPQTCETCRYAVEDAPSHLSRRCIYLDRFVLKTLNGQPFGCRAHDPKGD